MNGYTFNVIYNRVHNWTWTLYHELGVRYTLFNTLWRILALTARRMFGYMFQNVYLEQIFIHSMKIKPADLQCKNDNGALRNINITLLKHYIRWCTNNTSSILKHLLSIEDHVTGIEEVGVFLLWPPCLDKILHVSNSISLVVYECYR